MRCQLWKGDILQLVDAHQLLQEHDGFAKAQLEEQLAETALAVAVSMSSKGFFTELLTGNVLLGLQVRQELVHEASSWSFIPFLGFWQGEPLLGLWTVLKAQTYGVSLCPAFELLLQAWLVPLTRGLFQKGPRALLGGRQARSTYDHNHQRERQEIQERIVFLHCDGKTVLDH